ncbi:MAG TPA: hypothetical protein VM143_14610 [Acidimicrobiales bacterium]|nr:hypothetical protein [Acidimicrobiales bacterium]
MHLATHALVGVDDESLRTEVSFAPPTLTSVIVVDRYQGWYRALDKVAQQLPAAPAGRSWHHEVFCLPIGRLGTFRQSRTSGRWFIGPHRVHQAGSAHAPGWALE